MKYNKPEVAVAGLAAAAIQNPNPNPKLSAYIADFSGATVYHTPAAYAADE